MPTLTISDRAYLIMHLHAIKYHNFDCIGVLIGSQDSKSKQVSVEDVVPLFHQRFMTGSCEIAFDMIQSIFLKDGQKIIGLYEGALPHSLEGGKEQTNLAQYLCEQLHGNFSDSVFIQIKADLPPQSDDIPVKQQMLETKGLLFKSFFINQNGSIQHIDQQKIADQNNVCNHTEFVVKKYVQTEGKPYLKLYDFDDHFADVKCDWRNQHIQ